MLKWLGGLINIPTSDTWTHGLISAHILQDEQTRFTSSVEKREFLERTNAVNVLFQDDKVIDQNARISVSAALFSFPGQYWIL